MNNINNMNTINAKFASKKRKRIKQLEQEKQKQQQQYKLDQIEIIGDVEEETKKKKINIKCQLLFYKHEYYPNYMFDFNYLRMLIILRKVGIIQYIYNKYLQSLDRKVKILNIIIPPVMKERQICFILNSLIIDNKQEFIIGKEQVAISINNIKRIEEITIIMLIMKRRKILFHMINKPLFNYILLSMALSYIENVDKLVSYQNRIKVNKIRTSYYGFNNIRGLIITENIKDLQLNKELQHYTLEINKWLLLNEERWWFSISILNKSIESIINKIENKKWNIANVLFIISNEMIKQASYKLKIMIYDNDEIKKEEKEEEENKKNNENNENNENEEKEEKIEYNKVQERYKWIKMIINIVIKLLLNKNKENIDIKNIIKIIIEIIYFNVLQRENNKLLII